MIGGFYALLGYGAAIKYSKTQRDLCAKENEMIRVDIKQLFNNSAQIPSYTDNQQQPDNAMQTKIKILTRRKLKGCHYESDVTIDWTGVTPEQMQKLAQIALIHNLQAKIRAELLTLEQLERITILAAEAIHEPSYNLIEFAPRSAKSELVDEEQVSLSNTTLDKLLSTLSKEELLRLLG